MSRKTATIAAIIAAVLALAITGIALRTCAAETRAGESQAATRAAWSSASKAARPIDASQVGGYERLAPLTDAQRSSFLESAGRKFGTSGRTVLTVEGDPETGPVAYFYVEDARGLHWHVECSDTVCAFAQATKAEAAPPVSQAPAAAAQVPAQQDTPSAAPQKTQFDWSGAVTLADPKAAESAVGEAARNLYATIAEYAASRGYAIDGPDKVVLSPNVSRENGMDTFPAVIYSGNDQIVITVSYDPGSGSYGFGIAE